MDGEAARTFRIQSAEFTFADSRNSVIRMVGEHANPEGTHLTLLVGANGCHKSRMLAGLASAIRRIHAERDGSGISELKHDSRQEVVSAVHVSTRDLDDCDSADLPTRLIVLSNLVSDRFTFTRSEDRNDFYRYLGVRQASNMMTVSSQSRAVAEALLELWSQPNRRQMMHSWLRLLFASPPPMRVLFDGVSPKQVHALAEGRMPTAVRQPNVPYDRPDAQRQEQWLALQELARYLTGLPTVAMDRSRPRRPSQLHYLDLDPLRPEVPVPESVVQLLRLARTDTSRISAVVQFQIGGVWLELSDLSSGEQNIISTGAKIVATACPKCLILIDEPEVSLNVAWQQRYVELLYKSLEDAPGSHVIIATHSPHLIGSLPTGHASVVLMRAGAGDLQTTTLDATYEGWGSESILYHVLDLPSASTFELSRDLARALAVVESPGAPLEPVHDFLLKAKCLQLPPGDPLEAVVQELRTFLDEQ